MTNTEHIQRHVADYYTEKITQHGISHWGVDWNSTESQELRFAQLLKLRAGDETFSLLDYGCGYGALVDYMLRAGLPFTYTGYDIAPAMIEAARKTFPNLPNVEFTADVPSTTHDYVVASGIFNVRQHVTDVQWQQYMHDTIGQMWSLCRRGMAFNALTSYSDTEYTKDYLHYADPLYWFDYFKRNYSRWVSLLHDYGLYEFTIIVRHDERSKA